MWGEENETQKKYAGKLDKNAFKWIINQMNETELHLGETGMHYRCDICQAVTPGLLRPPSYDPPKLLLMEYELRYTCLEGLLRYILGWEYQVKFAYQRQADYIATCGIQKVIVRSSFFSLHVQRCSNRQVG